MFDSFSVIYGMLEGRYIVLALFAYVTYTVIYRLFLWPLVFSPLRNVPGPPLGHLLWGQMQVIVRSECGVPQREWVKEYGPVVRVLGPFGLERMMFLKPEALHQILVKDWLDYPRPSYLRNILGLITGYGLLTVTGNDHKLMRKAMNPAFSLPNLMAQTDMYYESIEGLIEILKRKIDEEREPKKGKVIPMYEWLSKVTLDIICETAFGYKADSLHNPNNELSVSYERLQNLQSGSNLAKLNLVMATPGGPRFLSSAWAYKHRRWFDKTIFFGSISTLIESMHNIRRISGEMLREKMSEASVLFADTDAKRDIMSILVRARMAEINGGNGGYAMSDKAMMDQVLTFLGAGHDTTATGLTWTLWLLANDQESQRRLRAEVAPVFSENPHPDYRTLKDLQWLDCVIMESLRVMPPVPLTVRKSSKTDYIDGVLVPKGTLFTIPIQVVNTWKEVWGEDAEEFHPKRWLNLPKDYHSTFSMLSFIAGAHGCIGKTMAILEMKAILSSLILNFEFEPAFEGQVAKPAAAITMKPTDGLPLRVRRVEAL